VKIQVEVFWIVIV